MRHTADLYPFLDAGWDYTFDRNALYRNQTVYWNEMEARAGFSIPLNWTRYTGFTSLQFGSDLIYNQRYYTGLYKDTFNSRGFAYIDPYYQPGPSDPTGPAGDRTAMGAGAEPVV